MEKGPMPHFFVFVPWRQKKPEGGGGGKFGGFSRGGRRNRGGAGVRQPQCRRARQMGGRPLPRAQAAQGSRLPEAPLRGRAAARILRLLTHQSARLLAS